MMMKRERESDFQAQVIHVAKLYGWLCYHTYDSRRSTPGYPDLALLHPVKHRYLLRELKTDRGRLKPAQSLWIETLKLSGIDAAIWRPSQWDAIIETLRA